LKAPEAKFPGPLGNCVTGKYTAESQAVKIL